MFSVCSSHRCSFPQWRWRSGTLGVLFQSNRRVRLVSVSSSSTLFSSSMNEDSGSIPKQSQVDFDPAVDLFGLDVNLQSRNVISGASKLRSWFGPNGQYIRELPCPSCRGRGYTPCTECGIERSRLDCSQCHGKGLRTCKKCFGDCVIWEESIDEQPWEKARTSSPLKVKEDDEVDKLDIELDVSRKSKRVYQSLSPEVSLKISRSLRSLNAKTGLFSKRMKILHRDPELFARRVAAIKKAKGTPAARKRASEAMKAFFSDPENRRKRSLSMKGVKFYCSNCGEEGHRIHYCPELDVSRRYKRKCHLCGERGHNRRTCPKAPSDQRRNNRCRLCAQSGHNRSTCPNRTDVNGESSILIKAVPTSKGMPFYCSNCGEQGHSSSSCPALGDNPRGRLRCQLCGEKGHSRRSCPKSVSGEQRRDPLHYFCRVCRQRGHNRRTCTQLSSSPNKTITANHVTCSFCLMKGHNIRTCPGRNHSLKV